MLSIDRGFAGGVCCCANCGKLIAVPSDPASQSAEVLVRPQRPRRLDRPDVPGGPGGPGEPAAAKAATPTPPVSRAPADDQTLYTTESGRTVRVDTARVPVARRKKQAIRMAVVVGFWLVMASVIAGVVAAVLVMGDSSTGPAPVSAQDAHRRALGFDPDTNPFMSERLNFLGLGVRNNVVLAIDASDARGGWFDHVKLAVVHLARQGGPNLSMQVVFWTEDDPEAHPDAPKAAAGGAEALSIFLESVTARGAAEPVAAVSVALKGQPDQVILVTAQRLFDDQIEPIQSKLEFSPHVRFDALLIDVRIPVLESMIQQRDGTCVTLPARKIAQWVKEAT